MTGATGPAPFVSVVVPTRDRPDALGDCLTGLLSQSYPADRYEVLVVDDGSSDGTAAAVERLSSRSRVRYVRQDHRGVGAARNAGSALARGDPICFVDDDTVAPPHWLEALVAAAGRNPRAPCLGGPVRPSFERPPPRTCGSHLPAGTSLDYGTVEARVREVWGANMAARRATLESIGGFSERMRLAVDFEWQLRLLDAGGWILYTPDAWLWHRPLDGDLGVARLAREYFRRGYTLGTLIDVSARPAARRAIGALRHAATERCVRGVTDAAKQSGVALAAITRRRRTAPRWPG